jgi:hypothetical protein
MSENNKKDISAELIREAVQDLLKENLQKTESADGIKAGLITMMPIRQNGGGDTIASILEVLKKSRDIESAQQLSFDVDPNKQEGNLSSIFRRRQNLIPVDILKRLRDTEELIGGVILPVRARQMLMFSRPRANRFDVGFAVNIKPEAVRQLTKEQIEELKKEAIPALRELMVNCGRTDGLKDTERQGLGQFLMSTIEDALLGGSFAAEIRKDGKGDFHSWRSVDALTIHQVQKQRGESAEALNIRKEARALLQKIKGEGNLLVDVDRFSRDEYSWVQVIDGIPRQVFTDEELVVMNMNPSTDINRNGYPVSPVERILSAVTTHINLTSHNKMYFVNGRAARNVMIFKSNDLSKQDIDNIKLQMQAHINSVNSAWRVPVFGMGVDDALEIQPLDGGNRDMEFQYLADLNKRMIFAAYQMSPDEVAALSYLSRGTNSQSLSESNNEWKLMAARDIGLRPLLMLYEDFFNERLLPKINEQWSKYLRIDLEGLDADSPEKEATRLQQDQALYLSMNDIMERVEKDAVPLAGQFPMNPAYLQVLEKYYTKGQILKAFGGEQFKAADQDPELAYCMGDQTSIQVFIMKKQAEMQQATMQQQAALQQQQGAQQPEQGAQQQEQQPEQEENESSDLDSAIAQLGESLNKSESKLPVTRKELLKKHKLAKAKILKELDEQSKDMINSIEEALTGKDPHEGHNH